MTARTSSLECGMMPWRASCLLRSPGAIYGTPPKFSLDMMLHCNCTAFSKTHEVNHAPKTRSSPSPNLAFLCHSFFSCYSTDTEHFIDLNIPFITSRCICSSSWDLPLCSFVPRRTSFHQLTLSVQHRLPGTTRPRDEMAARTCPSTSTSRFLLSTHPSGLALVIRSVLLRSLCYLRLEEGPFLPLYRWQLYPPCCSSFSLGPLGGCF
jgi:hypothetical protein